MRNDKVIQHEGMSALRERLDPVEVEKFIMLINRKGFDYTEWQRGLWEDKSVSNLFEMGRTERSETEEL